VQRQDLEVGPQHLGRIVGRSVVEHQQLVVAAEARHHLADLPEEHADGGGLVVDGNADI
jgi:hypothetical protein